MRETSLDLRNNSGLAWAQLDTICLDEKKYWQLRAKQQWLKECDFNTKIFIGLLKLDIGKTKF